MRGGAAEAVRLARIAATEFTGRSQLASHPDLRVYLGDLTRPYGVALREDLLERGEGHAYGEMAAALIRDLVPPDEAIDLLVLAYDVPDVQPGRQTSLYLSHVCPGRPLAFAICDQGIAAPYTAVRLATEYLRSGDYKRALVIVVEQATLHYELVEEPDRTSPVVLPNRSTAVALLCDGLGAPGPSSTRERTEVGPDQVRQVLSAELAELSALVGRRKHVLVLGSGLSKADVDGLDHELELELELDLIVTASADQPCTGAWFELARGYPQWREQGSFITLADYDRHLQTLCFCAIAQPRPEDGAESV